jgi:ankyrin repeat protein
MKWLVQLVLAIAVFSAAAQGRSPFLHAVENDQSTVVARLLAQGADPNEADERGNPALLLALRAEAWAAADVLARHPRTQLDAANAAGETALMMAALRGSLEWTRRLVGQGAAVQRSGWSPLHYAASGPEPRVVELLLSLGAPIEAPSPNGTTPLMMAAGYGAIDAVAVLLARGADPKARNALGIDAAEFARRAGRDDLAATLARRAGAPAPTPARP